jgi:dinuclear metal center YbgI/SA1388 family protein
MTNGNAGHRGVPLTRVVDHLDQLLETASTPDYPNALNGLQLANSGSVTKVAAAVDFSTTTVDAASKMQADLLIVHHGMFWSGLQPFTDRIYLRLRKLIDSDIAIYSSHLPLDRHPKFGNNVLLARALGLEPLRGFAHFKDISIGVQGDSRTRTSDLVERAKLFSRSHGGNVITPIESRPDRITERWAICTGAGATAETLEEATENGIDTLIVGEGPHWTAINAAERGITVIYVGHYASETLGVYALADEISQVFNVDCVKISAPTGL